jgi:TDG/mug DNA glycosylase family protein
MEMGSRLRSFPPVSAPDATLLILGSMPGAASLQAGEYYAHPRNGFWPIMGTLCGAGRELPYAERLPRLSAAGVALWDVLQSCVREGSLDTAIDDKTSVANDFEAFFRAHPQVRRVFFNGAKAEQCFRRQVLGKQVIPAGLMFARLPSTSPAHAGMSVERKLGEWRVILEENGGPAGT